MARNDIVRILLIIGAIVAIVEGIMIAVSLHFPSVVYGILCIVLGVVLLASTGAIHTKRKISVTHWLVMIILGIVLYFLGAIYGGIIVIIAGIVSLVLSL